MNYFRVGGRLFHSAIQMPVPAESDGVEDTGVYLEPSQPVPDISPPGTIYQDVDLGGGWKSTFVEDTAGYLFRSWGRLEARYSPDFDRIDVRQDPSTAQGFAEVMLAASLLTPLFNLLGFTTLHASGVLIGDRALAICGSSGAGKSSLAFALARAGFPVLSDDLLPVTCDQNQCLTWACSNRLRLREARHAVGLGHASVAPELAHSADGRYVATFPIATQTSAIPLGGVALPVIVDQPEITVRRLPPTDALIGLLGVGKRMLGTACASWLARDLQTLSSLVSMVPVTQINVPRGEIEPRVVKQHASGLVA